MLLSHDDNQFKLLDVWIENLLMSHGNACEYELGKFFEGGWNLGLNVLNLKN